MVIRLLQTIKRLGEENAALIEKNDRLATLEHKRLQTSRELNAFKEEYTEKFKKLREKLKEFSDKYPSEHNPGLM